jgi:hypothetical protein
MSTKSYTLIPHRLQDHNIQSWQKSFFPLHPKGTAMCISIFLFLSELGTCPQNLIPTRGVEHWEKNHFSQGGTLKFTYKGRFLTIKIAYEKFLDWKSERWKHALVAPSTRRIFFWKKLKSRFLAKFQSFIFGQILANFGSFG